MKNLIMLLGLFLMISCREQKTENRIVNDELLREVTLFTNELEAYPESRDSYNVTVNIRKKESGIYKIWIINCIPVTGCENLIGDVVVGKYKVFLVIEEDVNLFAERDNKYKCSIQPPDPEDLSGAHYFEGFYEYDGKTMKLNEVRSGSQ